jgi:hypothetical protein
MRRIHILFLGLSMLAASGLAACGDDASGRTLDLSSSDVTPSLDAGPVAVDAARPTGSQSCTQVCDYAGCHTVCEEIPAPVTPTDPYAD